MNRIEVEVNNGRTLQLVQFNRDEPIAFSTYNTKSGLVDFEDTISPGDFVTMLNWYRYQKEIGNANLEY